MRKEENESLRIEIINSLVRSEFKDDNTYEGAKYIVNKVLEILKRPEYVEKETNLEHFKDDLKAMLKSCKVVSPRQIYIDIKRKLDLSINSESYDYYTDCLLDWMVQPYIKRKRFTYELTRAEYEVLKSAPRDYPIKDLTTLYRLKEEHGWFKDVDMNIMVKDILRYCEIIGNEEKSDENS
nr:MAG TPA: hypothetical protein [Caudoviricetes sp.]